MRDDGDDWVIGLDEILEKIMTSDQVIFKQYFLTHLLVLWIFKDLILGCKIMWDISGSNIWTVSGQNQF